MASGWFRRALLAAGALALAGCAAVRQPAPPPDDLFVDAVFGAPAEPVSGDDALAVSPAMRAYLQDLRPVLRSRGPLRGLVDALYRHGDLKLDYDSERTRSASEAFEARSGNCLSLVIMTAALARELKLRMRFYQVDDGGVWERNGDLAVRIGHVNVSLADPMPQLRSADVVVEWLTIDFQSAPDNGSRMPLTELDERRLVAMYLNNRAVEALFAGRIDDAYVRVRDALRHDPDFVEAYTTLGVIYRRRGVQPAAEATLRRALQIAPAHTPALGNLAALLRDQGRIAEADVTLAELRRLEPVEPLAEVDAAYRALAAHDYGRARSLFRRALRRDTDQAALHHGLAVAEYQLGDRNAAAHELELAQRFSTSRAQRDLYAAKRDRLRGEGLAQ